jgi:hypothetical protein
VTVSIVITAVVIISGAVIVVIIYHVAITMGAEIFQKVLEAISQLFNFSLTTLGSNPRKPSNQSC